MDPITAYSIASAYVGLKEIHGTKNHPFIQWCFSLCGLGLETPDEVPWCSAFLQHAPYELGLVRSHRANARSWLKVGRPIELKDAVKGFDVVILKRGGADQPGPEVTDGAPGHVGLFSRFSHDLQYVYLLGGNQSDSVSVSAFPVDRILGVRRLV